MIYLIQKAGKYYFNRRVPEAFRAYDSRSVIRFSLKTQDRKTAIRHAIKHNDQLETYRKTLKKPDSSIQKQTVRAVSPYRK